MVDAGRARRMSARIKQIVASTIETQIKDPRLGMVTITDVRLTGDLHDATVFYTVLGDAEDRASSAAGARIGEGRAAQRGRAAHRRAVHADARVRARRAARVGRSDQRAARAGGPADAEVEQARVGATPAGEADPYRRPHDESDDE